MPNPTKKTTSTSSTKKTTTTTKPRTNMPVVTGKSVTVKPKTEVRQTYHQNEVYVVKDAMGKPQKVSYQVFQKAPAGKKQRMSAADAKRLFGG